MEENKVKKEMTLNSLAELIEEKSVETKEDLTKLIVQTRKALEAKIDSVEENLATSTQKQFLAMQDRMDQEFSKVNSKIDNLELEVKNRYVHIFTHKELEHRVEKIEEKMEITGGK
jgi:hypothetical protein